MPANSIMPTPPLPPQSHDRRPAAVTGKSTDYPARHIVRAHQHPTNQLIHAVHGVMVVSSSSGHWIVPPTRGIWMPAGTEHQVRMIGMVKMRTVYIWPDASPDLPTECKAVSISSLLRELILAAMNIPGDYLPNSRHGRVMQLLIDEVALLPTLPLHLPHPSDPRLLEICDTLADQPDDASTLKHWSERLEIDTKTIQRLFARETGMTFGQWRQQARLLKALELLAGGERVLDVALQLGYDSPSAFATMFKRQFGTTPTGFFE